MAAASIPVPYHHHATSTTSSGISTLSPPDDHGASLSSSNSTEMFRKAAWKLSALARRRRRPTGILIFPVEILQMVIENLSKNDKVRLRQVCKELDEIVAPMLWRHLEVDLEKCLSLDKQRMTGNLRIRNVTSRPVQGKLKVDNRMQLLLFSSHILRNEARLREVRELTIRMPACELSAVSRTRFPKTSRDLSVAIGRKNSKEVFDLVVTWLFVDVFPEQCRNLRKFELIKKHGLLCDYDPVVHLVYAFAHIQTRISVTKSGMFGVRFTTGMKSLRLTECRTTKFILPKTLVKLEISCNRLTVDCKELKETLAVLPSLEELAVIGMEVTGCESGDSWLPSSVHTLTLDCTRHINSSRLAFPTVRTLRIHISTQLPRPFDRLSFPNIESLYVQHTLRPLTYENTVFIDLPTTTLTTVQLAAPRIMTLRHTLKNLPQSVDTLIFSHAQFGLNGLPIDDTELESTFDHVTTYLQNIKHFILDFSINDETDLNFLKDVIVKTPIETCHLSIRPGAQQQSYTNHGAALLSRALAPLLPFLSSACFRYEGPDRQSDSDDGVDGYTVNVEGLRRMLLDEDGLKLTSKKSTVSHDGKEKDKRFWRRRSSA